MIIARQLREKNIAEYLLYMWQIEDLIRANGLDIEKIRSSVISNFDIGEKEKNEMSEWYENLIDMMRREDVAENGHLQINENVLIQLQDLHMNLLQSSEFPFYHSAYYKALPVIVELRTKSGKTNNSELRTCFEALYGMMLLKLQKKEVTGETLKALSDISRLLSMLANYDDKNKKGELKIEA